MPDHLHFVCRLSDSESKTINMGRQGSRPKGVLDHLAQFKSYTTNQSWKLGYKEKLWQKSSYDRVLDMQHPFEEVVQYTLDNPVRKELANEWTDWPYSKIVDPWWV